MHPAQSALRQLPQRLRAFWDRRPFFRLSVQALGSFAFSFLLAGASLLQSHVPLALAPVCALSFGLSAVCAYAGAVLGYAVFWGLSAALEPVAAGFLLLAGSCLFQELLPEDRHWFVPAAAGGIYLLLGGIFVLRDGGAGEAILRLVLRLALLILSIRALSDRQGGRLRPYAAAVCLLAGLLRVQLPFGVPLGVSFAAYLSLCAAGSVYAIPAGAVCGLVLDLGCTPSPPQTACFCLSALAGRFCAPRKAVQAASFTGTYLLSVLIWGGEHAGWTLGALTGAVFYCILPRIPLPEPETAARQPVPRQPLLDAADVLGRMEAKLTQRTPEAQPSAALIFDSAADAVCRGCIKRQQCWHEQADETYRALSACADALLHPAQSGETTLSADFLARCIRADAFSDAVSHALRAQRLQLQAQSRCEEAGHIAGAVYGHLAGLLRALCRRPQPEKQAVYRMLLGVRAIGLRGDSFCGDCGTSFLCGSTQYVLLCDGMGTGAAAKTDAEEAIAVLQSLLTLGMAAQEAMQMLNELYLLRGDGCFSTVDLLELDLTSGEGSLYKWGAAPSYLKKGGTVKKIGTASLPPGLDVGEKHQAGCVRLSLQRGEQLVLTTDGVPEAVCEQYLRACGTLSPRELAAGVVACASESEPDDRTAAVVQLEPAALQPQHTTRRARSLSKQDVRPHI